MKKNGPAHSVHFKQNDVIGTMA